MQHYVLKNESKSCDLQTKGPQVVEARRTIASTEQTICLLIMNTQDNNIKVLVVYHRVDFDGLASYCNTRSHFEHIGAKVEGFGYNYFDTVEMPDWSKYDKIVLVDIECFLDPITYIVRGHHLFPCGVR